MGRDIPNNGTVTDFMMDEFIRREIMPHFEYGTFIDGEGLWNCLLYTSPSPRD